MFYHLGRFATSWAWIICLGWLVGALGLTLLAPSWNARAEDDDVRFVPDRFTSVRAYQLIEKAFPQDVFASHLVFAVERDNGPLGAADYAVIDALIGDLERLRREAPELKLGKISSHRDGLLGTRLTSADRRCTLVQLALGSPYLAAATQTAVEKTRAVVARRLADSGSDDGLRIYATGAAGLGGDLTRASVDSLDGTTWATILLCVVVLLGVYRAPLLALVPLVTIGVSVWVSLNLLALMTLIPGVHLVNISKIFAIVILYGAGTDYCLFLISRYREELEQGYGPGDAVTRSVGGVGEALAASAGTVMVALGLMALAEFAKVRYAGPAIALSLGVALAASLTLTPALLRLLGKTVFWPGRPPAPAAIGPRLAACPAPAKAGFWERISRRVVRHPVRTWVAAALVLLPFVVLGLHVKPNYRPTGELSPQTESLQGLAALQRHFPAGEIGPVTVILTAPHDWASLPGQLEIERLSRGFAGLAGVAEVRSLTQPLGMSLFDLTPNAKGEGFVYDLLVTVQPIFEAIRTEMIRTGKEHYVSAIDADDPAGPRSVTRLEIVLTTDPFDDASGETLNLIQTWLRTDGPSHRFLAGDRQAECYGITANGQDLADVTEGDRHRVNSSVMLAIFLILLALVRRFGFALYLLVTVLASYYAALGATALASSLWSGTPLDVVDWRVPFFLFTILVAVGEDYNILLVSRAIEERKRHGSVEGMRRALARTGGAITSCGLIMAGTFATLMLAGLNTLVQTGFALAVGVLLDTFVVRPFLVPAAAVLFWKDAHDERPTHEELPAAHSAQRAA